MLEQENIAWLTYCIIFGLISFITLAQSILYRHIIPFTLYAIILVCSHIYITITPYYTAPDIPWRDQEPVLNQLPIVSILIFGGIIYWQFAYLNFINTAHNNYNRWGTLHPVVITDIKSDDSLSEKSIGSSRSDYEDAEYTEVLLSSSTPPKLLSKQSLWSSTFMLIVYAFAEFAFVISILAVNDPQTIALSSAICITVMSIPAIVNFVAIANTCIKCHTKVLVRIMEQIKKDLLCLLVMSLLFMIVMASTTALAWVAYFSSDVTRKPLAASSLSPDLTSWIVLKAFLVYFPLILIFLCCIFRGKSLHMIYNRQQKHEINHDI